MEQVKVTIDKNGEIKMEAIGAVGNECENWTRQLEQLLAAKGSITDSGKKPEYHMTKGTDSVNTRA